MEAPSSFNGLFFLINFIKYSRDGSKIDGEENFREEIAFNQIAEPAIFILAPEKKTRTGPRRGA